jgi:hypothetical protein
MEATMERGGTTRYLATFLVGVMALSPMLIAANAWAKDGPEAMARGGGPGGGPGGGGPGNGGGPGGGGHGGPGGGGHGGPGGGGHGGPGGGGHGGPGGGGHGGPGGHGGGCGGDNGAPAASAPAAAPDAPGVAANDGRNDVTGIDGLPGSPRLASISVLPGGVRKGTAFLTPKQEYTWEVFGYCNDREGTRARLNALKPDGAFSFELEAPGNESRRLARCMAEYGFTFASSIGEDVNFAPRPILRLELTSK